MKVSSCYGRKITSKILIKVTNKGSGNYRSTAATETNSLSNSNKTSVSFRIILIFCLKLEHQGERGNKNFNVLLKESMRKYFETFLSLIHMEIRLPSL